MPLHFFLFYYYYFFLHFLLSVIFGSNVIIWDPTALLVVKTQSVFADTLGAQVNVGAEEMRLLQQTGKRTLPLSLYTVMALFPFFFFFFSIPPASLPSSPSCDCLCHRGVLKQSEVEPFGYVMSSQGCL